MKVTRLVASHMQQMASDEEAEGHEGVPIFNGPHMQELQTLVNAVEASLDITERDQLTKLLQDHRNIFATEGDPPGTQNWLSMTSSWGTPCPTSNVSTIPTSVRKSKPRPRSTGCWLRASENPQVLHVHLPQSSLRKRQVAP